MKLNNTIKVKATVNGITNYVPSTEKILSIVEKSGFKIPKLCFDERTGPRGSCRMCLVEISINNEKKIVASCTQDVSDGIKISTHNEDLAEYRKNLLELILSETDSPINCPKCNSTGTCDLHFAVEEYRAKWDRFPKLESKGKPKDNNPFISRNYNYCISCYRCTDICNDWEQASAITPAGRGQKTSIHSFFENQLLKSPCTFCGQCINTCPTGALVDKKILNKTTPSKLNRTKTICPYCGVGCGIHLLTEEGEIKGVEPDFDSPSRGSLCVKGQFASWEFVKSEQRLKFPLIKKKGEFIKSSWSEALNLVAKKFSSIKEKNGPDSLVLWSSARVVTEANYLMQKFARVAIGTNNIDNCSRT
ncbi:MAG: hypothetical protein CL780_03630 [Chloroflexi bacterium]|nr:hypothetical protein [Chloroflexota bacterium]